MDDFIAARCEAKRIVQRGLHDVRVWLGEVRPTPPPGEGERLMDRIYSAYSQAQRDNLRFEGAKLHVGYDAYRDLHRYAANSYGGGPPAFAFGIPVIAEPPPFDGIELRWAIRA